MNAIAMALQSAASQFRVYERNHIEKGQLGKANTNALMAEMCEEALKDLKPDSFLARLRAQSSARADDWHGDEKWTILEWAGAMTGEAGEAANAAKKIRRVQQKIAKRAPETAPDAMHTLRAKLSEEIADTMIYLDLLAAQMDIDIEAAVTDKFNSVSKEFGFPQRL